MHKARSVSKFIETIKDRFRLFFLPPYSPELNPDERVLNDLKNNAIGRSAIMSPKQLHGAVVSHLCYIQKSPTVCAPTSTARRLSMQLNVYAIMRPLITNRIGKKGVKSMKKVLCKVAFKSPFIPLW